MRILVIGGNGFIGAPLVRELLEGGHAIADLHRATGRASQEGALHIPGDRNRLRECETELRRFQPQVIIDMILSSGEQARELAEVAGELGARVVAVSSMDVYRAWGVLSGTEPGGLQPMPLTEDSPLRTVRNAYPEEAVARMKSIFTWVAPGYNKVEVEQVVMSAGAENSVVRLPMVYGPGDPLHRLYGIVRRIQDGRPAIILPDDFAAWRGPRGYVDNMAHAIVVAATSKQARGRIYHVGEDPAITELEWQKKIAAQAQWPGKFVVLPRQHTPKHLLMQGNAAQHMAPSSERIRSELGYQEPVPTDEALRRTIAWEGKNVPTGASLHQFDYSAEDAALAQAQALAS